MSKTAEYWIQKLSLSPHPEGGFFKEIYRSQDVVKSSGNDEDRKASTSIYYLLKQGQYSSWHTLKSDEIWHHYDGSDIKIYIFDRKNKQLSIKICGRESENASFQVLIPKNTWFAAELAEGKYALVGCTVAPGFEFKDFIMGKKDELLNEFPDMYKELVLKFLAKNEK